MEDSSRWLTRRPDLGPPRSWGVALGLAGLVAAIVGLTIALGLQQVAGVPLKTLALIVAGLLGVGAVVLVSVRFEWFLLGLMCVRPSLDILGGPSGSLEPSTVLGIVFLLAGCAWLLAQKLRGDWQPVSPATAALLVLAACGLVSFLVSQDRTQPIVAGTRLATGALMFAVMEQLLPGRPQTYRRLLLAVLMGSVVPIAFALWQMARGGPVPAGELSRVAGTFAHPNPLATYLVMVLCAAVALWHTSDRRLRITFLAIGMPAAVALIGTYARAAWISFALAVIFLVARRHPRRLIPVSGGLILLVLLVPSIRSRFADLGAAAPIQGVPSNSLSWRLGYWERLVELSRHNPITGIGLEMVQLSTPERLQPHNVWVQAYVEIGIVGLVTFAVAVLSLVMVVRTRLKHASSPREEALAALMAAILLTLLLQSITENLLTQTMAYWYAAVLGGYGFTSYRVRRPRQVDVPAPSVADLQEAQPA